MNRPMLEHDDTVAGCRVRITQQGHPFYTEEVLTVWSVARNSVSIVTQTDRRHRVQRNYAWETAIADAERVATAIAQACRAERLAS